VGRHNYVMTRLLGGGEKWKGGGNLGSTAVGTF
jgi:hypothetical protein